MIHDIEKLSSVNVLIDRSRTGAAGLGLNWLFPARAWQVTENHRRLSWHRLSQFDLLLICGNAPGRYTPSELMAIKRFVRGGGSLILSANAGSFELSTGLSVAKMTANSVAELFGFSFLSAADLPADINACRGYRRQDLVMTPAGRRLGLDLGDLPLRQPGPLATPPGATILLRKKLGSPVAATAKYGRGRLLVFGDLEAYGESYDNWAVLIWTAAMVPQRKSAAGRKSQLTPKMMDRQQPYVIGHPLKQIKSGSVSVFCDPAYEKRARVVLRLANKIWTEAMSLYKCEKTIPEWHIKLFRGCHSGHCWRHDGQFLTSYIGGDVRDDFLAWRLSFYAGRTLTLIRFGYVIDPFWLPLRFYFVQHMLRKLEFDTFAEILVKAYAGGEEVDFGRVYSEVDESPAIRRLCIEVADEFGSGYFKKAIAAVPKKNPYKYINRGLYRPFDIFAYILARAIGTKVYRWLEKRGHTVRRIPALKAGSQELKKALKRSMMRIVANQSESAADRYDALRALAESLAEDKVSFDKCARLASGESLGNALPGAARLALARDERAIGALKGYLRGRDRGLAAVVALLLTSETRYRPAMDKLVTLAAEHDNRFKLAAGHALSQAGDKRGRAFSFAKLQGCELKVIKDGFHKIFPVVDGYEVANVWGRPFMFPMPSGAAFSSWYIEWVHTAPRWRRRGLAQMTLPKCIDHRWNDECAVTSLHTGTRNVAHSLYRQQGMIDYWVAKRFTKSLKPEFTVRPPRGVSIREARAEDSNAVLELWYEFLQDKSYCEDAPALVHWPADQPAYLAWEGKKLVGAVSGSYGTSGGSLRFVLIAKPPESANKPKKQKTKKSKEDPLRREKIGLALLNRVHKKMLKRKMKTVTHLMGHHIFGDFEMALMGHAGYSVAAGSFVELHRINRLDQYLSEMKPALEGRLAKETAWRDWTGLIVLQGSRLRAKVAIDKGAVKVLPLAKGNADKRGGARQTPLRKNERAAVTITGDDEAIGRIVLGCTSPFEEQLQIEVETAPTGNPQTTQLLEILFPRLLRI